MKYNESEYLKEIEEYVKGTYSEHYVGLDDIQAIDLIFSSGHGEGFCVGSINKYLSRYGKKAGFNRKDLLKIAHYTLFLLFLNSRRDKKD